MKKARTLLAIWLALILTLTLFPTALADGGDAGTNPDSNGGTATFQPQQVYVDLTNANITDLNPGQRFNSSEDGATITFKIAEGYEWVSFQVYVTATGHVADKCELSVDEASGVYTLTIPAEVITNKVAVKLFTEKAAPSTDTEGDGSDDDQTTPSTPQGGDSNLDEGDPTNPGDEPTPPQPKTRYTVTFKTTGEVKFENGSQEKTVSTDENGTFVVISEEPTIANHSFLGWFYNNRYYFPGQKVTVSGNATFTARVLHNVTIAFTAGEGVDSNAVSGIPETKSDYKPDSTISLPTPTRVGYNFQGWSYKNNVYTSEFKVPYDLKNPYTVTLTATWEPATKIAIDYDKGQAKTASIPTDTFVYQPADGGPTTFNISGDKPSRHDGSYSFSGWRYSVDNKLYNPGNTITIPTGATSVKLTAEWSPATYPDYDEDDDRPSKPSRPSKPTYDEYRIRATCSDGGWVSPAGSTYVREGRNLTVTFAPYKGYAIDGVYIDGVLDNRFDGSYTFRDVDENHTIYVRYVRDSGSSGGSSGGGSHWDDDTSPKTGDTSAPLSMGLGVGSLALIAFLVARKMRRA